MLHLGNASNSHPDKFEPNAIWVDFNINILPLKWFHDASEELYKLLKKYQTTQNVKIYFRYVYISKMWIHSSPMETDRYDDPTRYLTYLFDTSIAMMSGAWKIEFDVREPNTAAMQNTT